MPNWPRPTATKPSGGGTPPLEIIPAAKAAAARALELDPLLAEAHASTASVSFSLGWDWQAAGQHFRRALELKPNRAATHSSYGYYLECMGRFEEAIAHRHHALELDPFSPQLNEWVAYAYIRARRHEEAVDLLKQALALHPDNYRAHAVLSWPYALTGALEEARRHAELALARSPAAPDPAILGVVGWTYGVAGMRPEALGLLEQLEGVGRRMYVDPIWSAFVLSGLGENERAIEAIRKAVTLRSPIVVDLKVEAQWDSLRDEPRFQDLLKRMNFPGE